MVIADFLDSCLNLRNYTPSLFKTGIIGAIEGGLDMKARTKSTKEVLAREMDVFLLDGFHFNGPDSELLQFSNTRDVLAEIVSLLPVDKPRFYFGAGNPAMGFNLTKDGVDIFIYVKTITFENKRGIKSQTHQIVMA